METCRFYGWVSKTVQGLTLPCCREKEDVLLCVCVGNLLLFREQCMPDVSWRNIPDNLNSSSEAILTDMSWEKRSFWGRANVSGRLLIGSLFSLAPKVLKASRWEAGGVSSVGGGSTSMGSAFTFTFWKWASLLFSATDHKTKRGQLLVRFWLKRFPCHTLLRSEDDVLFTDEEKKIENSTMWQVQCCSIVFHYYVQEFTFFGHSIYIYTQTSQEGWFGQRLTSGPNSIRILPTQRLKPVAPLQLVRSWRSLLDERWNVFKKLKQIQLPTIQHTELTWPGWLRTFIEIRPQNDL